MCNSLSSLSLRKAIRDKYAWPGGYPMYCVTSDGAALCMDCAKSEYRQIAYARRHNLKDGWRVDAVDVNYEDASLYCDHCNERIESAYAEDEAAHEHEPEDDSAELWLCSDCMSVEQIGGFDDMEDARIEECEHALNALTADGSMLASDSDSDTGDGSDEFSWRACDCCGSRLGGARHRYKLFPNSKQ